MKFGFSKSKNPKIKMTDIKIFFKKIKLKEKLEKTFLILSLPFKRLSREINKTPERKNLYKDIKNITLILISCFTFLFLWVNRINFYPDNIALYMESKAVSAGYGSGFPREIEGDKTLAENMKFLGNNIAVLSDTALSIINSSSKIVREEQHSFSNPAIKTSKIRYIAYDRGGKNFKIGSSSKNIYCGSTEKSIISCSISETGAYGVITQSPNYLAEMTVYTKRNTEKYKYSFSEYYVSDTALNCDGSEGVVSGISTENGNINSNVYILDFKLETPKLQFKLNDNMITHVEYLPGGNVVAIGDKYMCFIDVKSKSIKNYSYDNKMLKFYDFSKENGICCCFSPSVNASDSDEIIIIGPDATETLKIKTKENFKGISHGKNRIIGLSQTGIISYGCFGSCDGIKEIHGRAKKAILAPHSYVYLLNCGSVDKVKMNHLKRIPNN